MQPRPEFDLGDIVQMKKKHPCGSYQWQITRMGADIKMKCQICERVVMLPRSEFERRLVKVVAKAKQETSCEL